MSHLLSVSLLSDRSAEHLQHLLDALKTLDARIVDVQQHEGHFTGFASLVIDTASDHDLKGVKQHLDAQTGLSDAQIDLQELSPDDFAHLQADENAPRFIATLLGRTLSPENIQQVISVALQHGLRLERIRRLSENLSVNAERACVELALLGAVEDITAVRKDVLAICQASDIDIAIQEDDIYRRHRRLVVFDMDSTLIKCEVIDELARAAGTVDEVAKITAAAMRGEIPFDESFRTRLGTLKGLDETVLKNIAENLPIMEGADRLMKTLKGLGYKVGILSGGFEYFAEHLKARWGIDCISANKLEIVDGKMTGEVKGQIINGDEKARRLKMMAEEAGFHMAQTVAVGDGANDLPMLSIAGLGVAFHAKPLVQEKAKHSVSTLGLDALLYLLGIADRDIDA